MYRFICLLAILTVAGAITGPNSQHTREEWVKFCKEKHAITDDELKRFDNGHEMTTRDGECFLNCLLDHHMDFHKNGDFDLEVSKEAIKKNSKSKEIEAVSLYVLERCAKHVFPQDNHCDQAKKLYNCMIIEKQNYIDNLKKEKQ